MSTDDRVHVAFTKFGARPHWQFDAIRIGEDAFGTWVLLPRGTPVSRPGTSVDIPVDAFSLSSLRIRSVTGIRQS